MLTIDQLLIKLARRELSIDAACAQLDALAAASPDPLQRLIARVQTEVAVGRLAHDAGRRLITVLESAGDKTIFLGPQTKVHADATVLRSPVASPPADDDRTIRKPAVDPDSTMLRPPPAAPSPSADMTQLRPPLSDPTMRSTPVGSEAVLRNVPTPPADEATQRHSPSSDVARHDRDVTFRGVKPDQEPTLRAPKPGQEATVRGKPDPDLTLRGAKPGPDATLVTPKPGQEAAVRGKPGQDVTLRGPKPDHDATLVTPKPGHDATLVPPKRDHDATVHTAVHDEDSTRRTMKHDADATLHTAKHDDATIVGTRAHDTRRSDQRAAYAATLNAEHRFADADATGDEEPLGELRPGSVIKKRFMLETMLGRGGMGSVFGAVDRRKQEAQDPNPRVALKVLNPDFARHPQSFIALQREARKAQTLAHPNVVTVFDFDRDGDFVYMTMEMLTGRTLDSVVRETRGTGMKREVALPIIRGIAEGLAYAHRKGFVHSDLKPGNVFLTEDSTPKILDFGIARAMPHAAAASGDIFDAGSFGAYTEPYATDEMVAGVDPHPADDLYALGIIAYEMLTGAHPYNRKSGPEARKLGLKPAPLKGLKLREARAIERCLSLDRKKRPKDAGEFLKLFRGVTALQKATMAAAVVLAVVAGYFWYENYRAINPDKPFEALPLETQQEFRKLMDEGNESWRFYAQDHIEPAINDAIRSYGLAYALHPRNKEAREALDRAATALFEVAGDDSEQRREGARYLLDSAREHFERNPEVLEAAR